MVGRIGKDMFLYSIARNPDRDTPRRCATGPPRAAPGPAGRSSPGARPTSRPCAAASASARTTRRRTRTRASPWGSCAALADQSALQGHGRLGPGAGVELPAAAAGRRL